MASGQWLKMGSENVMFQTSQNFVKFLKFIKKQFLKVSMKSSTSLNICC